MTHEQDLTNLMERNPSHTRNSYTQVISPMNANKMKYVKQPKTKNNAE